MAARLALAALVSCSICLTAAAQQLQDAPAKDAPAKDAPKSGAARAKDPFQAEWQQAMKEVAEARKAIREAKTEEDKAAAQERARTAQQKLAAVSAKRTQAVQRMALRAQGLRYAAAVRKEVDADDNRERFLLLLSPGPVIVEATITLDGEPFRKPREALVDQLLAAADADKDGEARWEEALGNAAFTLGRVRTVNEDQRRTYVSLYDLDDDKLVSRYEVRAFLAQIFQGAAFSLGAQGYSRGFASGRVYYAGGTQRPSAGIWQLLDVDKDDALSAEEIAAVTERLKSRDANGDDLLYTTEISGGTTAGNRVIRVQTGGARQPPQELAVMLGPAGRPEAIWEALKASYAKDKPQLTADDLPGRKELFAAIDKNQDGRLEADEVLGLNDVPADLRLTVHLGETDQPRISAEVVSSQLQKSGQSEDTITFQLPGLNLTAAASSAPRRTYNYERSAKALLANLDENKDGYLVKDEVVQRAYQFAQWDQDDDGKVYAKEIEQAYTAMTAPQWGRVAAAVTTSDGPLFDALDISGDRRLSAREMQVAEKQLRTFDKNGDGKIERAEVPEAVRMTLTRGGSQYSYQRVVRAGGGRPAQESRPAAGPDWFVRMDRNGDGDVTIKEFLGTREAFDKLDTNSDGFIEPAEAKASEAKGDEKPADERPADEKPAESE